MENPNLKFIHGKKKKQRPNQMPYWQKCHVFKELTMHQKKKARIEAEIETKINEIQQRNQLKSNPGDPVFQIIGNSSEIPNTSKPFVHTNYSLQQSSVKSNKRKQKGKKKPVTTPQPFKSRNLEGSFMSNINPLGPKFIPLHQLEHSQQSALNKSNPNAIPEVTKSNIPTLLNTEARVTTLTGIPTIESQQKKILKFQMRLQKMKEQKRLKKALADLATLSNTTEINTETQSSSSTANAGVAANNTENKSEPAPIKTEIVETVFNVDSDAEFFTDPEQIPQQPMKFSQITTPKNVELYGSKPKANVSEQIPKQQIPKKIFNATTPISHTLETIYGFKYPAGIPKSFLISQAQQTSMQTYVPVQSELKSKPIYQVSNQNLGSPLTIQTDGPIDVNQPYSPSELYKDIDITQGQDNEESESSELNQSGQKRLSAFQRLGPQTQPKKPKLTISVTVNDDQEVREVVDETEELEEITPVHLREDIILSTDETVMKYLKAWPWKRNMVVRRTVTARLSKTVMILEREQMEEIYEKDTVFVQVSIKGYPPSWTKEQVMDLLMENMRGYSFIPCFIEFNREECKFLSLRCRLALLCLHKCGFIIRKDDVELIITLAQTELTLNQLDFVPRLILRKRVHMCADGVTKLNLSAFTLKEDISHFIYFPLSRLYNQSELIQLQTEIKWSCLTELDLSHNKIFSLEGFELQQTTPRLKHLNLSHNCIQRITSLLNCRSLPLKSIHLEGNPLCTDYIDPQHYIKVIKMMFPSVTTIDDVPVRLKGEMPKFIRNYCPQDAKKLVEKFLEIYFPLLEGDVEHRSMLKEMYEENANVTVTHHYKLSFSPIYRTFKTLFQNAREFDEGKMTMVKGSSAIIRQIISWPRMQHDPFTFTVDVLYHSDFTTIIRVDGILKLTRESLAEDEYLLPFSRTLVLHTRDCVEYKIQNETLFWSVPNEAYVKTAFAVTALKTKLMNPKIETTTDEKLQEELLKIFMKLTSMDKNISERCLEFKKWNLKEALDHFSKLLKLNSLETLLKDFS